MFSLAFTVSCFFLGGGGGTLNLIGALLGAALTGFTAGSGAGFSILAAGSEAGLGAGSGGGSPLPGGLVGALREGFLTCDEVPEEALTLSLVGGGGGG